MLVVDIVYLVPIEQIDLNLSAHRNFLQKYYDLGFLITSGPKNPRDGGIIIALTDKASMEKIIQEDPFYKLGLATYEITEFEVVKTCEALKPLLRHPGEGRDPVPNLS